MKLKNLLLSLALLAITSFTFSCALLPNVFVRPKIDLPARPQIVACEPKPDISGNIVDSTVVLKLDDAERLQTWIVNYIQCKTVESLLLSGQIEKLENRIKAANGE